MEQQPSIVESNQPSTKISENQNDSVISFNSSGSFQEDSLSIFSLVQNKNSSNVQEQEVSELDFSQFEQIQLYNDDEPINKDHYNRTPQIDLQKDLKFEIRPQYQLVGLKEKSKQTLPVQISLKLDNQDQISLEYRKSIDLVCVIDVSGSMAGEKLKLLKKTLNFILTFLNEKDRICLITFSKTSERILPLTCVSEQNKPIIQDLINSLKVDSLTAIEEGLSTAIKQIKERRYINQVTSVFLLSDGLPNKASLVDKKIKEIQALDDLRFTIHSFGYGSDHDPRVMQSISNSKSGNFYYIDDYSYLDEKFVDALGGLFSVGAQNIEINVNSVNNDQVQPVIRSFYGPYWVGKPQHYVDSGKLRLEQLITGVSKEFVIHLEFCKTKSDILDKNQLVLEASCSIENIDSNQKFVKNASLSLDFYGLKEQKDKQLFKKTYNHDVLYNYLRVKGSKSMQIAIIYSQKKHQDKAIDALDQTLKLIRSFTERAQNKVQDVVQDLLNMKQELLQNQKINQKKLCEYTQACNAYEINGNKYNANTQTCSLSEELVSYTRSNKIDEE